MATLTAYTNFDGDGPVTSDSASWDTAHDAATGSSSGGALTSGVVCGTQESGGSYYIIRGFLPFDTSDLPADASISSAVLRVYVNSKSSGDNDGDDWINVVQTSQASPTSIGTADFDQCGAINNPTEGATRADISSLDIPTGDWLEMSLNATGISWISTSGYTLLGLREGHDCVDSPIANSTNNNINIDFNGGTNPPELVITYTSGPTYTITADMASYRLTYKTASLLYHRILSISKMDFALTMKNTSMSVARTLAITAMSFALTLKDVTLSVTRKWLGTAKNSSSASNTSKTSSTPDNTSKNSSNWTNLDKS